MARTIATCPAIDGPFTLANAAQAEEITLTALSAARVTVLFVAQPGRLGLVGAQGAPLAAYVPIAADQYFTFLVGPDQSSTKFYVEATVPGTVCHVLVEPVEGR